MAPRKAASTICVLGAGGFIGSHLLSRLTRSRAFHVCGIDITSEKIRHLLPRRNLTFVELDIHDTDRLAGYIRDADTVISLVALCNPSLYNKTPLDVIEVNFSRPLHVVRMCADFGKRLVHFSTSEVYGKTVSAYAGAAHGGRAAEVTHLFTEDTSPLLLGPVRAQRWSYAAAKQLLERVIYGYGFERGLDYTIVRPFNFIGPRMDYIPGIDGSGVPRVLACFMEALMCGKPLKLVDGGKSRRCFTYIDDAVDAVMAVIAKPDKAGQQIFNIGSPRNEVTIAELAARMIAVYKELRPDFANVDFAVENVSAESFYGVGYDDSDRRVPDITKARTLLGWRPRTGLDTALRRTMAAYVEEYGADCARREAC
jgi:UDP-apiose/xylose synthase